VDPESELLGDESVRLPREKEHDPRGASSRPASGRRRRRGWWALLLLALVATSIVWYADASARSRESDAVRACETELRRASDQADYRMGLTTNYVRPVAVDGTFSAHLADLMAPKARQALPAVERADRDCKQVSVRPWHFSLVTRQHAATAYSGALVTLLQIVAAQGRHAFHGNATLQRLRDAAGLDGG